MTIIRTDDASAVMGHLGSTVQAIVAESIDEGFHRYRMSRELDPIGHADHSDCTKANIIYDRCAAVARELIGLSASDPSHIRWRQSPNKRQTVILVGDCFAIRIKRTKANRGGLSTGVETTFARSVKNPPPVVYPRNGLLDFNGAFVYDSSISGRLWLTAAYDLDDAEEAVESATIGVELPDAFLWRVPLPFVDGGVISRLPAMTANRVREYRSRRMA